MNMCSYIIITIKKYKTENHLKKIPQHTGRPLSLAHTSVQSTWKMMPGTWASLGMGRLLCDAMFSP